MFFGVRIYVCQHINMNININVDNYYMFYNLETKQDHNTI